MDDKITAKIKLIQEYNSLLAKESRLIKKLEEIKLMIVSCKSEINEKL